LELLLPTVPENIFLTKGVGRHKEKLASFELALRKASIEKFNIVNVSSILPPKAKIISKQRGLSRLIPGQILYCVMARTSDNEPNRLISASIGIAIPADRSSYGYISEHHAYGQAERVAGDYAEDLAASMLASTLGIDFDADEAYDTRRDIFRMSKKIVRTSSITQSCLCNKNGLWTTVVAAAVLID
jgi:arginine decarboxylase